MPKTLKEFCQQFQDEALPHAENAKRSGARSNEWLLSVVKIGKRYFYDPQGLLKIAEERKWDAFSVGLYLGEERKEFQPTSALVDLLGSQSDKRVVVGSKAAWLFLCGRDILMDGVAEPGSFSHNELVFVADLKGNILGYGKVVSPFNASMRNKTYVKHILDKGEYLRRER